MISSVKNRLLIISFLISFIPVATLGFLSYRNLVEIFIKVSGAGLPEPGIHETVYLQQKWE
ncbi:hypothetical protein [Desulfotruncus alcoholivorax]|uniref:hypothetical protein n=1 Tax=Desulfotruncus alcoholivorax TaxID=265477 RepID=UPI0003F96B30|nr:hypothetical protein [Desulfotruncus alcoholivorax]